MSERRTRFIYVGLIFFYTMILPIVFYSYTTFIPLTVVLMLAIGLVMIGASVFVSIHLRNLSIGKFLALYLLLVGICTLVSHLPYTVINKLLFTVLALSSNYLFFWVVGHLIHVHKKTIFLLLNRALLGFSVFEILLLILIYLKHMRVEFMDSYSVTMQFFFFFFLVLFLCIRCYKCMTPYGKSSVRTLLVGLLTGTILYFAGLATPLFAVSLVDTIAYTEGNLLNFPMFLFDRDVFSIVFFTGFITSVISVLIKKEYMTKIFSYQLVRVTIGVVYLIIFNLLIYIYIRDNLFTVYLFNTVAAIPIYILYFENVPISQKEEYHRQLCNRLDAERQRLSIFLHDEILQNAIHASHVVGENEVMRSLIDDIRSVSHNLYPISVLNLGLEMSIKQMIIDFETDYNIEICLEYNCSMGAFPDFASIAIYRIIKELITNSIKHAKCTEIKVKMSNLDKSLEIIVSDNGTGFLLNQVKNDKSLGVLTIMQNIEDMGGCLKFESGNGSKFTILIPYDGMRHKSK